MNNTNIDQTLSELNRVLKYLVDATQQPVSQQKTQFLEFQASSGEENVGKDKNGEEFTRPRYF